MRDTALVVMAAGIGSRFGGGVKQLEPVGPSGEIIMDYSIHDALEAGFNKVIFIIRKDLEKDFKEVIGNRISKLVQVEYAYQELDDIPAPYRKPIERTKPWGTGQAVLCAKDLLKEPFLVINADDYYGKEGFGKIHEYMINEMDTDKEEYDICMGGFILENTLSEYGGVTRGVCKVDGQSKLLGVSETYDVAWRGNRLTGTDENGDLVQLDVSQYVSMNMWGFPPAFVEELERGFPVFLSGLKDGDYKSEYLLPKIVNRLVKEGRASVSLLETSDRWFGVTYKEDKPEVVAAVRRLIENGVYKERLF